MKSVAIAAAVLALSVGCASRPIQLVTPCGSHDTKSTLKYLSGLVAAEGMQIELVNEDVGILRASLGPEHDFWTGMNLTKQWQFTIRGDTVLAFAKTISVSQNAFGATVGSSETYYSDKAHSDWTWYWNVRNPLQSFCGHEVIFIQK